MMIKGKFIAVQSVRKDKETIAPSAIASKERKKEVFYLDDFLPTLHLSELNASFDSKTHNVSFFKVRFQL